MSVIQLSESILFRLMSEALVTLLGQAERFEVTLHPKCRMVLSNEPNADWNMVLVGPGAEATDRFVEFCKLLSLRKLPFMAIIFPTAEPGAERAAAELGLEYAADFPRIHRRSSDKRGYDDQSR